MANTFIDPLMGFKYLVSFDGETDSAGFQRVTGITMSRGEKRWTEITDTHGCRKLPDVLDIGDVQFSCGVYVTGMPGEEWFNQVTANIYKGHTGDTGEKIRRTITVSVLNKGTDSGRSFEILNAFPKAIRIGDLDAMSGTVLISSMTVSCEGLRFKEFNNSATSNYA